MSGRVALLFLAVAVVAATALTTVLVLHHHGKPIYYRQDAAEASRLQFVQHGVSLRGPVKCDSWPVVHHKGWACSDDFLAKTNDASECFVYASSRLLLTLDCEAPQAGEWHGAAVITP